MDVSGIWGHDGLPFLDLTVDGMGNVSGTTYWRADERRAEIAAIKRGTFDPTTSAVRLEGDAPSLDGGGDVRYVIEGSLENDVLSGTYDCGGFTGCFTFTRIGASQE